VISAEVLSITLLYASERVPHIAWLLGYLQVKGGNLESIRLTPVFLFGSFTTCAGALLRYWCYRLLGDAFTFDINIRKGHRLVSTGPYSIVRHPGYISGTLNYCGLYLAFAAPVRDSRLNINHWILTLAGRAHGYKSLEFSAPALVKSSLGHCVSSIHLFSLSPYDVFRGKSSYC
jgi:isoprenylcysteine carboxyl methyltransferase (ICMT) family protein YpbQ